MIRSKPVRDLPRARSILLGVTIGLVFSPVRMARAEDPPPEGESEAAKIEAKMREILRLMRENGQAILVASQGGKEKPKGVTVTPPPADGTPPPTGTSPSGTPPPPDGGSGGMGGGSEGGMAGGTTGTAPGVGGEEIRRRMEEVLEQAKKAGGAIPKEIEELIRMIPKKKMGPPSGGPGQPEPESRGQRDPSKPNESEPKPGEKDDPKKGERDPKNRDGDKPPPDGEKERPKGDDTPPWLAELPPEVRRSIVNSDPEKVPPEYRERLIEYQKYLLEHAEKARDGR